VAIPYGYSRPAVERCTVSQQHMHTTPYTIRIWLKPRYNIASAQKRRSLSLTPFPISTISRAARCAARYLPAAVIVAAWIVEKQGNTSRAQESP
jgi:hypothetical protein